MTSPDKEIYSEYKRSKNMVSNILFVVTVYILLLNYIIFQLLPRISKFFALWTFTYICLVELSVEQEKKIIKKSEISCPGLGLQKHSGFLAETAPKLSTCCW